MTSLVAFIASDSEPENPSPASLYFISDSRRSWGSGKTLVTIDDCQKLYASSVSPELFGFTGNISFAQAIVELHVKNVETKKNWTNSYTGFAQLCERANSVLTSRADYSTGGFTIMYGARDFRGKQKAEFRVCLLRCDEYKNISTRHITIPRNSQTARVIIGGTGIYSVEKAAASWTSSTVIMPSRDIFCQFCDSITTDVDPFSGGAPQLAVLYRNGNAEHVGVFTDAAYVYGKPLQNGQSIPKQWRNRNFEVSCPTGQRKSQSQPQPRPSYAPAQPIGKAKA
jgi:hypothetical protein